MTELKLDRTQLARLAELEELARRRTPEAAEPDALARSDREAELEPWFSDHGMEGVLEVVPELITLGYDVRRLDALSGVFDADQLPVVLTLVGYEHAAYTLVGETGLSTARIVELVSALKSYTYLDRAPVQSADVRKGLEDTLIIVNKHKGAVSVSSVPGTTWFTVRLPIDPELSEPSV